MGIAYNTSIVRDGLVLHLDAANVKSYPGTGTTWYDLSGNGGNGILDNGAAFTGTSISFDGIDDKVRAPNCYQFSANENYTYDVWFNPTTDNTTSGLIGGVNTPMIRWGQAIAGTVYFFVGWSESPFYKGYRSSEVLQTGRWHNAVATLDHIAKTGKLYLNGDYSGQFTWETGTINVPPSTILFNVRDSSNAFLGETSIGKVYNRALTPEEIQQNFEALRGRYGI